MAIHMNNKINVGEYVRTDKGEIAKVTYVAKETLGEILGANEYRSIGFCNTEPYVYGNIVKHSKQLIDLIKCGDIVNRQLVIDKYEDVDEYGNDFWCLIIEDDSLLNKTIREEDIQTILTRESYMANCYKV